MALINCQECNREYSDTAKTCPHCGFTLKKTNRRGCSGPFLLTISIAFAIFTMIVALSGNQTETVPSGSLPNKESGPSIENQTSQSDFDWLKGGTLHNSTVLEWRNSSYDNKLATSADWLAGTIWKNHLNSPSDFDILKEKAELLVAGVDYIIQGQEIDSLKVVEISTAVILSTPQLNPNP